MEITAKKREELGKKTKALRKERMLPAVIYGKDFPSIPLTVDYNQFVKVFTTAGETTLVDINLDGKKDKVLIKNIQMHPVTDKILHVDFHKVDLTETISAEIPVEVVGEEDSSVLKSGEGMLLVLLTEITVEALPSDLPSSFKVDVSGLQEVGDSILIKDLEYDKEKVEINDHDAEDLIVKIDYAEMQEEEEEEISEEDLVAGVEATEQTAEDEDEGTKSGTEEASSE